MIVSASKRSLLAHCAYPWSPYAPPWDETAGRAAKEGSRAHLAVHKRDASLAPRRLQRAAQYAIDWLTANPDARTEVAVADGVELRPSEKERDYPPDAALAGTFDVVTVRADHIYIADWKFGNVHAEEYQAQMRMLAVLARKTWGDMRVTADVAYCGDEGIAWINAEVRMYDDEEELKRDLARVPEAWPEPGSWCGWCPCKTCPVRSR